MITTTLRKLAQQNLNWQTSSPRSRASFTVREAQHSEQRTLSDDRWINALRLKAISTQPNLWFPLECHILQVRMAERSKALRSGRSLVLQAWVRIPLLTNFFQAATFSPKIGESILEWLHVVSPPCLWIARHTLGRFSRFTPMRPLSYVQAVVAEWLRR